MQVLKRKGEEKALKLIKQLNEKSWHLLSTFPNTALVYPKQPEGAWASKALYGLARNSGPVIHAQTHTWFQDGCQALAFSLVEVLASGRDLQTFCDFYLMAQTFWQTLEWLKYVHRCVPATTIPASHVRGGLRRAVWPIRHTCPFKEAVLVFGLCRLRCPALCCWQWQHSQVQARCPGKFYTISPQGLSPGPGLKVRLLGKGTH